MYAPSPQSSPSRVRQRSSGRRRRRSARGRQISARTRLCELTARFAANGMLAVVAGVALAHLLPYVQTQSEQLQFVESEVTKAQQETTRLKTDFGRYFDPWQTQNVIQEQSGYKSPTERQIVWTDSHPASAPAPK